MLFFFTAQFRRHANAGSTANPTGKRWLLEFPYAPLEFRCDHKENDRDGRNGGKQPVLKENIKGAYTGGGDMPKDQQKRAINLIEKFEERLEKIISALKIPRRHIRPLAPGSVICGAYESTIFVGYRPQLGMATISFLNLSINGQGGPSASAFLSFLLDRTGQDFCVVKLTLDWLDLDTTEQNKFLDATAKEVIRSELSRQKVPTSMIPFNPVFGPNIYPINDNIVFVLMPFNDDLNQIYEGFIKPSIELKNLVARRADNIASNNVIIHDIWRSICESQFIIADLTGRNANVMYELGIAHTVGKETILIHQEKSSRNSVKFPFDIAHFWIINYKNTAPGGKKLRTSLDETIDAVLQKLNSELRLTTLSPA